LEPPESNFETSELFLLEAAAVTANRNRSFGLRPVQIQK
jgi:hypothetical protein